MSRNRGNPDRGPRREVVLDCPHRLTFDPPYPRPDDVVYCKWCRDYRRVLSLFEQYVVKCVNHCRIRLQYGTDLKRAERVAHAHVTKYAAHVQVRRGEEVIADLQPQQETLMPAYTTAMESEANRRKDHQTALRRFMDGLYK